MAHKKILRRRRADQDVVEQVDYYLEEGVDAVALRFLDAVDAACHRLRDHPEVGPVRKVQNPRLAGLRLWFVPDFPEHLIFYRVTEETVEILRILHAKRDVDSILLEDEG